MSTNKRDEYRRYCACIEDVVKVLDCYECPHYKNDQFKLENTCGYSNLEQE